MPSPTPMDLPPQEELVAMHAGGMSYADIAKHLGCSEITIRRRMPSPRAEPRIHIGNAATWAFEAPDWMEDGLCSQTDPEIFYPDKGGSTREAKAVCARCPVAAECLDWALDHDENFGIWGGLAERERRHIKKQISAPPASPTPLHTEEQSA